MTTRSGFFLRVSWKHWMISISRFQVVISWCHPRVAHQNHCLSRFLWSSTVMQFMFKNCFGCVVWNYSCQKPRVCLFLILTQLGLNLVIPPFSCHFLHMHMVVECILALFSTLHLIWNWLKWQHKFWNNSDFTYLALPSTRTTMSLSIQCSLSGTSWRNSSKK